jgi:AraC-like DNA-binding protein
MKYLDYKENRTHGSFNFPFAFYNVTKNHPRYQMLHHWHPEFELIRILEGSFTLQLNGQELSGTAGDSFLITGGDVHSGIPHACHYECIVFDINFFIREHQSCYRELLSIINNEQILLSYFPHSMILENDIFAYIFDAFARKFLGYELVIQGNFYHFFGIAMEKQLFRKIDKLPNHLQKMKLFKAVISMIQQHYSENVTLEDMATWVHMNPNYFCRFFKEIVHQTPMQYLNYYRIESACEKISTSDKSITEISLECGFNDVSYFIKVFRKFKGITPTTYHKRLHL